MYLKRIVADPEGEVLPQPDVDGLRTQIHTLVSGLDGAERTLVMLHGPGANHLAIGGDAASGLVVYMTRDNQQFFQMWQGHSQRNITVVAGGQPGDYPEGAVVDLVAATQAAEEYALHGEFSRKHRWEKM